MKKDYLKNSVQLGSIVGEIFLLDKKELIENILNKKQKEEIFEKVYESYKRSEKNITFEFYSDDFFDIISDLNILKKYFKKETNMSIEDLNNGGFVNDALVFYSLEIAKREYFGKNISVKELYNFVKGYNSNDELWEDFYDFLKEDEIKRIKETAESIAEEIKYLLETDIKLISVSEILEEKKDIFNSQNENFVIVSKENGYCQENSVLNEIFSIKEFNRDKISDDEIMKFLEEKIEELKIFKLKTCCNWQVFIIQDKKTLFFHCFPTCCFIFQMKKFKYIVCLKQNS